MSIQMEYNAYRRDHPIDSLERQLICPICLEMFTKPVVILPCQHNLCRKCANDIFQSRGTTLGSAGRFRCPSCRHEVVLDRHGVYGLQRNLLVENIIDIYKQESARCSNSSRPFLKTEHPSCEEHEEEKINIYCMTCGVPTCSLCKVFGEHKECEVAPLSDIYMKQKSELTEGIGALVATNDRIQAFLDSLQGTCRSIEDNSKAQKQALCEKFDRMYAILEERRKIMLQRITYEQEEKTQHLKALTRSYGEHIESSSKLVDTALQSMEEPQMAVFVQNAKVLVQKIAEMTRSCEVEPLEPGYDNMEHYAVDFNAEERVLYQLDFIKVDESDEGAEEGEEEAVWGAAEGTTADCMAEGQVADSEASPNIPMNGKAEEVEEKTLLLKEAASEAGGEVDDKAELQGSTQATEPDGQADKEESERDPGMALQKNATVLDGEANAADLDTQGSRAEAAASNDTWPMVTPNLDLQNNSKEKALESPAESAVQQETTEPTEVTCLGSPETFSTLDSSAGNKTDVGAREDCVSSITSGSNEGGLAQSGAASVSIQSEEPITKYLFPHEETQTVIKSPFDVLLSSSSGSWGSNPEFQDPSPGSAAGVPTTVDPTVVDGKNEDPFLE